MANGHGRICDSCGEPYHRRNLNEVWDEQNPGSRLGWHKTVAKICTKCMDLNRTRRMMMVASVRIGKQVEKHVKKSLTLLKTQEKKSATG